MKGMELEECQHQTHFHLEPVCLPQGGDLTMLFLTAAQDPGTKRVTSLTMGKHVYIMLARTLSGDQLLQIYHTHANQRVDQFERVLML